MAGPVAAPSVAGPFVAGPFVAAPSVGTAGLPRWMSESGLVARAAAQSLATDAVTVRATGDTLRAVVAGASTALNWRGSAALAAGDRAAALSTQLAAVASQLDLAAGALSSLASALDTSALGSSVLGSSAPGVSAPAASAASGTSAPGASALAVQASADLLVATDARTAAALHDVADALRTVHTDLVPGSMAAAGSAASGRPRGHGGGFLSEIAHAVRSFVTGTADAVASLGQAMGHHPGADASLLGGTLLTALGLDAELLGLGLDVTGLGAAVGVPVGAVSAGLVAVGAGMASGAAGALAVHAATDDHVLLMQDDGAPTPGSDPAGSGAGSQGAGVGPGPVPQLDVEGAQFAQRTARFTFSDDGTFRGKTIADIAGELRDGTLQPDDVPVDMITRDGRTVILNTRSSLALREAGIPRSAWRVVDRTGEDAYENRLTGQLTRNRLDSGGSSTVHIKGGAPR